MDTIKYKFNNKKFIKIRKEKGFTQKALAKILVHKYHIPNIYDNLSLIERNMRSVKEDELEIFAKALNVNIKDISDSIEITVPKKSIKQAIKNKIAKVPNDKKRQEYHNKIVYQMTINLTRYLKSNKISPEMKDICKEILLNTLNK
jgi:transcriptional regulator with XRE-family HTH domain